MKIIKIPKGPLDANMYIINTDLSSVIIDPCVSLNSIPEINTDVKAIIATHCHYDHVLYMDQIKNKTKSSVYAHEDEKQGFLDYKVNGSHHFSEAKSFSEPDLFVNEDSIITIDEIYTLKFTHTPGHTKGSMCILLLENNEVKSIFTGDTLFKGTIGRTDLPTGDYNMMIKSLNKFKQFNRNVVIYPGHGEETDLETEFTANPYLSNL